ncbi:helix-turn-helix transcriptional regulator [Aquabacterium sp.]|uniref:helix-turn-helix transcriptional regulator n=1 Tax=Aquabacterium sp. TaxID=1872578 RepID=UPI0035AE976C
MIIFIGSTIETDRGYAAVLKSRTSYITEVRRIAANSEMNWTTISDGAPESGGGAAAAAVTDGGAPVAAASDDDDGGDPDPEPARRRKHTNGTAPVSGESLLRLRGVQARVPLSKSAIYKMIAESKFPEPIRLSARCSLWRASDIDAFVANLT